MTVSSDLQARYPSQTLIELTNPRTKGASSINTTLLDKAIEDAGGDFKTYVQSEYDSTNPAHVTVMCAGVICKLQQWGGATGGTARIRFDDWVERCRSLARVGARGHEGPVSNSTLTPSTPQPNGSGVVRPEFDDAFFRPMIPLREGEGDTGQGG